MSGRVLTAALAVLVLASACSGERVTPAADPWPASTRAVPPGTGSPTPRATSPALSSPRPPQTTSEQQDLDESLIAAATDNDVRRARTLIRRGADVNAQDDSQQSAYLIAASEGHLELLNLTLEHGADVDAKDSFNGTGLIRAADRGTPMSPDDWYGPESRSTTSTTSAGRLSTKP